MYFLWEKGSLYKRDGETNMKFIVYYSDYYYPYDEVFDSLPEAISAFEKLKAYRKDQMEYGSDPYFATDYLGIIVDEISKEKMKLEMASFVPDED
jgi:hypothetical protein